MAAQKEIIHETLLNFILQKGLDVLREVGGIFEIKENIQFMTGVFVIFFMFLRMRK